MIKKLLATMLVAVPILSFAGNRPPPYEAAVPARPCMIRIDARNYINANAVTVISIVPAKPLYEVYIYMGNIHTRIFVPPMQVDKYILDLTTVIKNCGKGT